MWLVIITAATVGYGDFYLKTTLGRITGFVICFWGTFVVSYFVMALTELLSFTQMEDKAYTVLNRLYYKEELKEYALNVLATAFKNRDAILRV